LEEPSAEGGRHGVDEAAGEFGLEGPAGDEDGEGHSGEGVGEEVGGVEDALGGGDEGKGDEEAAGAGIEPREADGEGEGAGGVGAGEGVPGRAFVEALGGAAPDPVAGIEDVGAGAAEGGFEEVAEQDGEKAADGDGEGAAPAGFVDHGDGEDDQRGTGDLSPLFEHHQFAGGVAVAGDGTGEVGEGVGEEGPMGDGEVEPLQGDGGEEDHKQGFGPPGEGEVEMVRGGLVPELRELSLGKGRCGVVGHGRIVPGLLRENTVFDGTGTSA
jgi:hypothetical protein